MALDIHHLITEAQSAVDNVRNSAESNLLRICDENATHVFMSLINVALDQTQAIASRQFVLFALRKLITMYWSPGFDSYRTTSTINENEKTYIRDSLLSLSLDESTTTKIQKAASYCVVQICAVDFPDEWPNLLQVLYDAMMNHNSVAAMLLLNEIYDDVVSEEMFFEGKIGIGTFEILFHILRDSNTGYETLLVVLDLFHSCLLQMQVVNSSSSAKRKQIVTESTSEVLKVWGSFLETNSKTNNINCMKAKAKIYENLALLKSEFPRKLFKKDFCMPFKSLALNDLEECASIYATVLNSGSENEILETVNSVTIYVLEFLTTICEITFEATEMQIILHSLKSLCCLPAETTDEWTSDFNSFVSTEAGLMASFSIRDQAAEFLAALDDLSYLEAFKCMLQSLPNLFSGSFDWKIQESTLFLLQSVLLNESEPPSNLGHEVQGVPGFFSSALEWKDINEIVFSRIILLIPKFFEKFMDFMENIKTLTREFFVQSMSASHSSQNDLVKASLLISFTYYAYFAELPSVLGADICETMQIKILRLIEQVSEDAEEDTNGLLMEVLSALIDCNTEGIHENDIAQSEFHLVLSISGKDPSNIQTLVESQTCLEKILDTDTAHYKTYAEKCFPAFVKVLEVNKQSSYNYNPLLSLTLHFLDIFMKSKPTDGTLPPFITNYIFGYLSDIFSQADDDEILQVATSTFSYLVYNSDVNTISPHLEEIVHVLDRLLSYDISDIAAQYAGSLIVTMFTRFSTQIQALVPTILKAVTEKLIKANNTTTSQNLISVFCYLTSVDVQQTVDFLAEMYMQDDNITALPLVLAKWVDLFEEIRSDIKLKENIFAFSKLYFLQDPRLQTLQVNGEIIPYQGDEIITRSKAKDMPDKYTQVSFYTKIIKLFICELGIQDEAEHNNHMESSSNCATVNQNEQTNEDDWEDVEEVLEYQQLQEYIHDSDNEDDISTEEGRSDLMQMCNLSESVRNILLNFFKEVTTKNMNSFQEIYNSLSENEKKILTEHLI